MCIQFTGTSAVSVAAPEERGGVAAAGEDGVRRQVRHEFTAKNALQTHGGQRGFAYWYSLFVLVVVNTVNVWINKNFQLKIVLKT